MQPIDTSFLEQRGHRNMQRRFLSGEAVRQFAGVPLRVGNDVGQRFKSRISSDHQHQHQRHIIGATEIVDGVGPVANLLIGASVR